jgi:hypothetical protein
MQVRARCHPAPHAPQRGSCATSGLPCHPAGASTARQPLPRQAKQQRDMFDDPDGDNLLSPGSTASQESGFQAPGGPGQHAPGVGWAPISRQGSMQQPQPQQLAPPRRQPGPGQQHVPGPSEAAAFDGQLSLTFRNFGQHSGSPPHGRQQPAAAKAAAPPPKARTTQHAAPPAKDLGALLNAPGPVDISTLWGNGSPTGSDASAGSRTRQAPPPPPQHKHTVHCARNTVRCALRFSFRCRVVWAWFWRCPPARHPACPPRPPTRLAAPGS